MADMLGVLLAGGLARRMGGGDKALKLIAGKPILAHVIERLRPQVTHLVINANGDPSRFASFGLPVIADLVADYAGPLAGVLSGMDWARRHFPKTADILTVPCDGPFLPRDFATRLIAAREAQGADLACAASGGHSHPVAGLWPVRLFDDLRVAMTEEGVRKVDVWTARYRLASVDFPAVPVDPFFNANAPEDLVEAERLLPLAS